jgi:hypothetical protein
VLVEFAQDKSAEECEYRYELGHDIGRCLDIDG